MYLINNIQICFFFGRFSFTEKQKVMKTLKRWPLLKQSNYLSIRTQLPRIRHVTYHNRGYIYKHSSFPAPFLSPYSSINSNWNSKCHHNELFYGVYRSFAKKPSSSSSGKKPSKKKKSSDESPESEQTVHAHNEPAGDANAKPDIQHIPQSGELSTFVVIKEKTQEGLSIIYIVGILMVCLPYTIYLVFKSLFSSSGSDKIRNETFDLIKEDSRILRILGSDIIAKQVNQNVSFLDDSGQERMQIIYQIQGGKGIAKVHVEMLKEEKDWRIQYCIVQTQYSDIPIVDNRSLFDRPAL